MVVYGTRFVVNNGCPRDMCFNEIGLVRKVLHASLG